MMNELQKVDVVINSGDISFSNYEALKSQVETITKSSAKLVVMADDIASAKKNRANLNKLSKALNDKRKEIKNEFSKPVTVFEDKVSEIDKLIITASNNLDVQIKKYEKQELNKRIEAMKKYFNEQATESNIDFVSFEQVGLNITLSTKDKSMKTFMLDFIKQIKEDMQTISLLDNNDRILEKYKASLDLSSAIRLVKQEVEYETKLKNKILEEQKSVEPTPKVVESAPKKVAPKVTPKDQETIYSTSFKVFGTKQQIQDLRDYVISKGLRYENTQI